VTECQGCGAWNDASRTLCVLCGTPLAEIDEWDAAAELPPLPSLPDGGLAASMPSWLREPPGPDDAPPFPVAGAATESLASLGPRADPRTFLTDDDFPRWLRDLAARDAAPAAPAIDGRPPLQPPAVDASGPFTWPDWPADTMVVAPSDDDAPRAGVPIVPAPPAVTTPTSAETMSAPVPANDRPPVAAMTARTREERRERSPWETLLLVLLFIGVVVAALWALVANGVFSPSL
jgi:hypothetical protein